MGMRGVFVMLALLQGVAVIAGPPASMLELEATANKCEAASSCTKCMQNPACGWCDGGVGYCVPGTASGPAEWYAPKMPDTPYGKCSTWQFGRHCAAACSTYTSCTVCNEDAHCGWCGTSQMKGSCIEGTDLGPAKGACPGTGGQFWAFRSHQKGDSMCMAGWSKEKANAGWLGKDKVYDPSNDKEFAKLKGGSPSATVTVSGAADFLVAHKSQFTFFFAQDMSAILGADRADIKVDSVTGNATAIVEFTCKGKNGGAKVGSVAATGTTNLLVFKALSKAAGKIVKAETPLIQKPKEESSLAGNSSNGTGANGTDSAAANAFSVAQNSTNATGANGTQ